MIKNKFNWIINFVRVIIIFIISLIILIPITFHTNKSYYKTISSVNYWEVKELSPFLKHYLEHQNISGLYGKQKENIVKAFYEIRWFHIEIYYKNKKLLLTKELPKGYTPNLKSPYPEILTDNGFTLKIYPRIYKSWRANYKEYLQNLFTLNCKNLSTGEFRNIFGWHVIIFICLICLSLWLTARYYSRLFLKSIKLLGKK